MQVTKKDGDAKVVVYCDSELEASAVYSWLEQAMGLIDFSKAQ